MSESSWCEDSAIVAQHTRSDLSLDVNIFMSYSTTSEEWLDAYTGLEAMPTVKPCYAARAGSSAGLELCGSSDARQVMLVKCARC